MIKDTIWAYMAGYFDGDGCVNITKSSGRHRLQIVLTKKDDEFLNTLRRSVGNLGSVSGGCWRIVTQEAEDFLHGIYPYVVKKREQVETALEFRSSIGRPGNLSGSGLTNSIIEERDELMIRLQLLKGE